MHTKSSACRHFMLKMIYRNVTYVSTRSLQTYRAMDADGRGGVSFKEFKQGKLFGSAVLRTQIADTSAQKVFRSFDSDGNGSLTASELAGGLASLSQNSAATLLAAQEKQSPSVQLSSARMVAAYSTLPMLQAGSSGNTAYQVVAAYFRV